MSTNNAKKKIITFLVITIILSIIFYGLIIQAGGVEEEAATIYVALLMWSPGLAGLITTFIYQRNLRGIGWGLGKPRYLVIGYILPVLYAGIIYGAIWLFSLGKLDTSALEGNLMNALLKTLTGGVLGAALLAVGEEIGWRGLLVPQMAKINPFARTAVISGVIWGIWHLPLLFWGGYSSGAPTWYAALCFMVAITGLSFAFTWLRLASGSIWPTVLMHAVHNTIIQSYFQKITADTSYTAYIGTEFGLGLAISGVIISVIFLAKGRSLDLTAEASSSAKKLSGN
jgi:membrane protease YdiL (CAAX protease family)